MHKSLPIIQKRKCSLVQSDYRKVLTMTVSALRKANIPIPMDSQATHDAVEYAGIDPSAVGLPPLAPVRTPALQPRMSEQDREARYQDGPGQARSVDLGRFERADASTRTRLFNGDQRISAVADQDMGL